MPQKICPRCIQRITYDNDCNDYVHECTGTSVTLTQEDNLIISKTVTEFGSTVDTGVSPSEVMMQGVQNRFAGTLAGIEGERFQGVTRRGANASTHRQRQHYEFMDNLKEDKNE